MLVSAWPLSMRVPELHDAPFQPKTRPTVSTARQKVGVGHETPVRPEASAPATEGSVVMGMGAENAWPFQTITLPALSTRTQNVVEAHDTEFSWPLESAPVGWV